MLHVEVKVKTERSISRKKGIDKGNAWTAPHHRELSVAIHAFLFRTLFPIEGD